MDATEGVANLSDVKDDVTDATSPTDDVTVVVDAENGAMDSTDDVSDDMTHVKDIDIDKGYSSKAPDANISTRASTPPAPSLQLV